MPCKITGRQLIVKYMPVDMARNPTWAPGGGQRDTTFNHLYGSFSAHLDHFSLKKKNHSLCSAGGGKFPRRIFQLHGGYDQPRRGWGWGGGGGGMDIHTHPAPALRTQMPEEKFSGIWQPWPTVLSYGD
jgi:hypothetical protein